MTNADVSVRKNVIVSEAVAYLLTGQRPCGLAIESRFPPLLPPHRFTQALDNDVELIKQICGIGECLAGFDGDLILAAALSQYPDRMRNFVDDWGWSWVRYRARSFEQECGTLPDVLKDYCGPKRGPVSEPELSYPLTIEQLATLLGKHRNTVRKLIKQGKIPVVPDGSQYRIELSYLSSEARDKLREWESSRFKTED